MSDRREGASESGRTGGMVNSLTVKHRRSVRVAQSGVTPLRVTPITRSNDPSVRARDTPAALLVYKLNNRFPRPR